jgi:hypothetical protein
MVHDVMPSVLQEGTVGGVERLVLHATSAPFLQDQCSHDYPYQVGPFLLSSTETVLAFTDNMEGDHMHTDAPLVNKHCVLLQCPLLCTDMLHRRGPCERVFAPVQAIQHPAIQQHM